VRASNEPGLRRESNTSIFPGEFIMKKRLSGISVAATTRTRATALKLVTKQPRTVGVDFQYEC
jgi:hypothetical protein